ncbi:MULTISPECIES: hypothetical protein [unclassified Chelatococcus]|uniref:hypothetical protein n=1 Tax=unclassified Chelatococcus TaxID=2638111 RepID=UPI001BCBA484|nr:MULTISPECIES: hypothetical protein [unclassified Chelatococcus]MBS7743524.1 hypothetical protein [Chelatococcus sp. HY11]MBS7743695.1 hypothetical protein [Chelatococcus sp. HY11]MBX3547206.1 hypothetical protein [Chelatococcus sp.]
MLGTDISSGEPIGPASVDHKACPRPHMIKGDRRLSAQNRPAYAIEKCPSGIHTSDGRIPGAWPSFKEDPDLNESAVFMGSGIEMRAGEELYNIILRLILIRKFCYCIH